MAIRDITHRGRLPIVVGGTGLDHRAATRGFFPGPARDSALRDRLEAIAYRKGPERLHRLVGRVDPASAQRIQPRDLKRVVRALEVYLPDRPSADRSFRRHAVASAGVRRGRVALQIPAEATAERVARRVEAQFRQGLLDEIRGLLVAGVPPTAHPFTGLGDRQSLEHLNGVRDETATRELIVRENKGSSRRQLIWFRKEPNLQWIHAAGERDETQQAVTRSIMARLRAARCGEAGFSA